MTGDRITIPLLLRAEALRDAGLSYPAIASVLELDHGVRIGHYTLRRHLTARGRPKDMRRMTAANLASARANLVQNRRAT